jgi:hypothetical protein
MKTPCLLSLLVASMLATGCSFENVTKLGNPAAPSADGTSSGTATGNSSGSGSTTSAASAFSGAWGSSTIAGLPLGNCADVKWLITTQTSSSVSGTVSANCASGVTVTANLTGTLQSEDVISLVANGTLTAMGLPCQFNLTGTGTRQPGDTMRVNYTGSHCVGAVSGTETLRKFPDV